MQTGKLHLALVWSGIACAFAQHAHASCSDLALVLAIDASASIDETEYDLQMKGYALAMMSPEVTAAIEEAGRVEAAAIIWGDANLPIVQTDWVRIDHPRARAAFAADLTETQRTVTGNTGLATALKASLDMLLKRAPCDGRRIVNVSGDGRNSVAKESDPSVSLALMKARAAREGVTVNALAIETTEPVLEEYFYNELITGNAAFVMAVPDFWSFGDAIRAKLWREIRLPQVASSSIR